MAGNTEKFKIYVGIAALIITNATSIVTAFIAANKADKADKEETAKAAYKELSKAIEKISSEQVQISKDMANLHGYLSGMQFRISDKKATGGSTSTPIPTSTHIAIATPPPKMNMQAEQKAYSAPDINELPIPKE